MRNYSFFLLIVLFLGCTVGCSHSARVKKAERKYESGEYIKSRVLFQKLNRKSRSEGFYYFEIGRALEATGYEEGALEQYKYALKHTPGKVSEAEILKAANRLEYTLARESFGHGQYRNAIEYLDQLIDRSPGHSAGQKLRLNAKLMIAKKYQRAKRCDLAVRSVEGLSRRELQKFDLIEVANGIQIDALLCVAEQEYKAGHFDNAYFQINRVMKIDPGNPRGEELRYRIAITKIENALGNQSFALAQGLLDLLFRKYPEDPKAIGLQLQLYMEEGEFRFNKGQFDRAVASAEKALSIRPELDKALSLRCRAHFAKGEKFFHQLEYDEARAAFSELGIECEQQRIEANRLKSLMEIREKIAGLEAKLARDPNNPALVYDLARFNCLLGEPTIAMDYLWRFFEMPYGTFSNYRDRAIEEPMLHPLFNMEEFRRWSTGIRRVVIFGCKATNLPDEDDIYPNKGISDPRLELRYRDRPIMNTAYIKDAAYPEWSESCVIDYFYWIDDGLSFTVFDDDTFNDDLLIEGLLTGLDRYQPRAYVGISSFSCRVNSTAADLRIADEKKNVFQVKLENLTGRTGLVFDQVIAATAEYKAEFDLTHCIVSATTNLGQIELILREINRGIREGKLDGQAITEEFVRILLQRFLPGSSQVLTAMDVTDCVMEYAEQE